MRIGVIGCGVVGGTLADAFEDMGFPVSRLDPQKGYDTLEKSDVLFICVYDYRLVEGIVKEHEADVIAIKTTLPLGTTDKLIQRYGDNIAYVPEFLTEKTAKIDFLCPDRVIIGCVSNFVKDLLLTIHSPFNAPIFVTSPLEAEIIKLACNAHHALKVEFANEIYDICQSFGADYEVVRKGIEADRYITPCHMDVFDKGYRGFGGKCLPKDVMMLIAGAYARGASPRVIAEALRANDLRRNGDLQ